MGGGADYCYLASRLQIVTVCPGFAAVSCALALPGSELQ